MAMDVRHITRERGSIISEQEESVSLSVTLATAVPLWIERWKRRPVKEREARLPVCSQYITENADRILFKSMSGQTHEMGVAMIAEGLALLSFQPGGIDFAGMHWQTLLS